MKKQKHKLVKPRNFVAKNQQTAGAGRHRDKKHDYKRHPKHKLQLEA
jgi:hypothetical protein